MAGLEGESVHSALAVLQTLTQRIIICNMFLLFAGQSGERPHLDDQQSCEEVTQHRWYRAIGRMWYDDRQESMGQVPDGQNGI